LELKLTKLANQEHIFVALDKDQKRNETLEGTRSNKDYQYLSLQTAETKWQ